MHGLIALYLGYIIYLVIFFRAKKRDRFYKEITVILGLKLLLLTSLYFFFFDHKMTKTERKENVKNVILT